MNKQNRVRALYRKLLTLYPQRFKEQLAESMEQTFSDLYQERQTEGRSSGFVLWMFVDTAAGIVREHVRLISEGDRMKNLGFTALIGSILLAVAFILAPAIYLVGNLRDAMGPFAYAVADFLYGPVWAVGLVSLVLVLRERIGEQAPRRMSLALFAAVLAAGTMIIIACIRSANRQYHLLHPELHLEDSLTVLTVWGTLVAGLTGAGFHFLGWTLTLIGSVGWTSRQLPRLLSILYFAAGAASLFVYLLPVNEGLAILLGMIVSIWQGILLWKVKPEETQPPATTADQPDRA
jgi:hypothetical protein